MLRHSPGTCPPQIFFSGMASSDMAPSVIYSDIFPQTLSTDTNYLDTHLKYVPFILLTHIFLSDFSDMFL